MLGEAGGVIGVDVDDGGVGNKWRNVTVLLHVLSERERESERGEGGPAVGGRAGADSCSAPGLSQGM